MTLADVDGYSVDDLTRAVLVSTVTAEVGPDLKGEVQFHLLLLTTLTLRLEFGRDFELKFG